MKQALPIVTLVLMVACVPRPHAGERPAAVPPLAVGTLSIGDGGLTVLARSDGWVELSTFPWSDRAFRVERHIAVRAADVAEWERAMRQFLADTTHVADSVERRTPVLGRGRSLLFATRRGSGLPIPTTVTLSISPIHTFVDELSFVFTGCTRITGGGALSGSGGGGIVALMSLLERAALAAGTAVAERPSLERPFYRSEVSCPAMPMRGNPTPSFPPGTPADRRRPTEIGVRFVVDTSGRVERGSFATLPGTDPPLATAARVAVTQWRFVPAQWADAPVRQVVQESLLFSEDVIPSDTVGPPVLSIRGERDGWVRLDVTDREDAGLHAQEWFLPDSVDAWLNRIAAARRPGALPSAQTQAIVPTRFPYQFLVLGSMTGVQYAINGTSPDQALIAACPDTLGMLPTTLDSGRVAQFSTAARDARRLTPVPVDPALAVHGTDVACPPRFPGIRSTVPSVPGYNPDAAGRRTLLVNLALLGRGEYPAPLLTSNISAELLYAVTVDTAGSADLATLTVMPDADPRFVAALRATLAAYHFRPAYRGGIAVRARTIQAMFFEPPLRCTVPDAAPVCQKEDRR